MALMYSFCFWFSVRLGSIIIGGFSIIQTLIILILLGVGYDNQNDFKMQLKDWMDHNNLLLMHDILSGMRQDPDHFFIIYLVLFSLYAVSCILLILGAYICNIYLIYPYIITELIRLVFFSFIFIYSMIIIKENNLNLGVLIGGCVGGGFLLLYLFYMWACTISLVQIIKILEKEDNNELYNPISAATILQPGYPPAFNRPVSFIPLGLNNQNPYILSKLDQ